MLCKVNKKKKIIKRAVQDLESLTWDEIKQLKIQILGIKNGNMDYDAKRREAECGGYGRPHVVVLKSSKCKYGILAGLGIPMAVILILVTVLLVRVNTIGANINNNDPEATAAQVMKKVEGIDDGKQMERAQRLAEALKFTTVSFELGKQYLPAMLPFHDFLAASFPLVHNSDFISLEKVNNYSLLYTIEGTHPGKMPYMLCSHFDTVPAIPASWTSPPFAGQIINETYIYGRGAIDDKGGVMGILEAIEYMLSRGERPKRSLYLAFGHDEEIGGGQGAEFIATTLRKRGVTQLDFIMDEGFAVTTRLIPGTSQPIALIGVAEKGVLTLNLTVTGDPGHSSMPPWESPIGILSKATQKLEETKLPSLLGQGVEGEMFEIIAPYCDDWEYQLMYSNIWLFKDTLTERLQKFRHTNGMIRTTTALTIFRSGDKENVVPGMASAIIQHRIHPSQTMQDVFNFDKDTIADDRVHMAIIRGRDPPPTSPYGPNDLGYQLISKSVTQTFGPIPVAPGVMIANTDTLRYISFSNNIYRFQPYVLDFIDTARIHGIDERVAVETYQNAVSFYYRLIQNADNDYELAPNVPVAK